MHSYDLSQWILFFFFYSFVGWIWESCYVSARKRRWVNRGFMHGPMLPLYGSGAVVVLISTIGVRENGWLIFLLGMLGATLLEYITGAAMERLFHVRYWDYSNQRLNLNGYICVSSSLCWGCFSVLLVRVVHVPVEELILGIPGKVSEWAAFLLTAAAAVDLTQSFNEAMDMKRILVQLEESRERVRMMQEKLRTASEELVEEYRQRSAEFAEEYREKTRARVEMRLSRNKAYLVRIHERREERRRQLTVLLERAEKLLGAELPAKTEELTGKLPGRERLDSLRHDLEVVKQNVLTELQKMGERTDRNYLRAARLLRRNPTAVSGRFKEALEEIRRMMDK